MVAVVGKPHPNSRRLTGKGEGIVMQARVSRSSPLAARARERANAKNTTVGVKVCIALLALVPALAACGSSALSSGTSVPPSQNASAPLSPGVVAASTAAPGGSAVPRGSAAVAAASSAPPAQEALSCKTDIDPTGAYLPKKDMTAEHLIALLGAMLIVHGR